MPAAVRSAGRGGAPRRLWLPVGWAVAIPPAGKPGSRVSTPSPGGSGSIGTRARAPVPAPRSRSARRRRRRFWRRACSPGLRRTARCLPWSSASPPPAGPTPCWSTRARRPPCSSPAASATCWRSATRPVRTCSRWRRRSPSRSTAAVVEVPERLAADGSVVEPLELDGEAGAALARAADEALAAGCASAAVALLHSYLAPGARAGSRPVPRRPGLRPRVGLVRARAADQDPAPRRDRRRRRLPRAADRRVPRSGSPPRCRRARELAPRDDQRRRPGRRLATSGRRTACSPARPAARWARPRPAAGRDASG